MPSNRKLQQIRRRNQVSFTQLTTLMIKELRDICAIIDDLDQWSAPSECYSSVPQHNPELVIRENGRTMKWWCKEARRRGLSKKWCYLHNLPYPARA